VKWLPLLLANVTAALAVTLFFSWITLIAPEPYIGYFSKYPDTTMTLVVNLALSVPFLVTAFLLWQLKRKPRSRMSCFVSWVLFAVLVLITLHFLHALWRDQFAGSRGFALVGVILRYPVVFLPVWILSVLAICLAGPGAGRSARHAAR
jgi:hypothetical protein